MTTHPSSAQGSPRAISPLLAAASAIWIVLVCLLQLAGVYWRFYFPSIYGVFLSPYPRRPALVLATGMVLVLAPAALLLRGRARQWLVLLVSLAIGVILAGWPSVLFLVCALGLMLPLPFLPVARTIRLWTMIGGFIAIIALSMVTFNETLYLSIYSYYFLMICGFRYVLFFYDVISRPTRCQEVWLEYFIYLLAGPYFMVVPYQIVIPPFSSFRASAPRKRPAECLTRSAYLMFWAVVNGAAVYLLVWHQPSFQGVPSLVRLMFGFTLTLLQVSCAGHFLVGLLTLWGYEVADPFRFVFLARSLPEFLNRFAPHFTQFLATVFYFPLLIRFRKWGSVKSRAAALAIAILFGNTFVHLFRYGYLLGRSPNAGHRMLAILEGNVLLCLAIFGWLLVERTASRLPAKWPGLKAPPMAIAVRCLAFASIYVIFTLVWSV